MSENRLPDILAPSPDSLNRIATCLREGGLVALPTETVYGLGANACDGRAVARIFEAKGRPAFNPLIIHVASTARAREIVDMDARAESIAQTFWPGPLTLVLRRRPDCRVSPLAGAGLPTLAVRVPAHPTARLLLESLDFPIAAPSANRSGTLSPTTPRHVLDSLGGAVDMILAGGACSVGLESTILDLSTPRAVILRPGSITAEQIAAVLDAPVTYDSGDPDSPRAPGQLLRHYAPRLRLRRNAVDVETGEALLAFGSLRFMGVRGGGFAADLPENKIRNLSPEGDLYEAAANLFAMLHALDDPQAHHAIAVMSIPTHGLGYAINDRLTRAAAGSGT